MRVMIQSDGPHAHYYIRMGWAKVFSAIGWNVSLWEKDGKSAFDAFDEFEPTVFMGQTYNLSDAIIKCIKERPHMKVVMRASDWGQLNESIDREKYPILKASEDEIRLVDRLKRQTGKPDFVHNHYTQKWIEETHGHWREIGVEPVSLIHGADVYDYYNGVFDEYLASDVAFVGGYWPYKAKSLDRYMLPICDEDLNVKIFGNNWPTPKGLGRLSNERVKNLFVSSVVCPNVSEPHSQDFGYDIIERPFKVLLSKGFCISDRVQSMEEEVFPDQIVYADNPEDFKEKIHHFVKHPEEREKYIQKGFLEVLTKHTYFHRVSFILEKLGFKKESEQCLSILRDIIS